MSVASLNTNKLISEKSSLFAAIRSISFEESLRDLHLNWETGEISSNASLVPLLEKEGYAQKNPEGYRLNNLGLLFFSRFVLDFESTFPAGAVVDSKYSVQNIIRIGKNSATFVAEHIVLKNKIVLKFIRPGAASNLAESLQLLSSPEFSDHLVQPLDLLSCEIVDIFGNEIKIGCVVYPYVEGETLREFLNVENRPLNSYTIVSFIKQVGGVLAQLEKLGAYHGDLHEENIIVNVSKSGELSFRVIDVSFGAMGSVGAEICRENDLTNFRQHLWNILSVQQSYLGKISIRKHLGSKIFLLISEVLSSEINSFAEIISALQGSIKYRQYLEAKNQFLAAKFSPPGMFKLQRYEEITDHTVALKLFVPFPELMNRVKEFGNIFVSGNRGSGKSTYLAALAFFPKVSDPVVDFKEIYGIYFPCRQGEFRPLSANTNPEWRPDSGRLKHVLITKIVRRTLETLADGVEYKKLIEPLDYEKLKSFLSRFQDGNQIFSLGRDVVSEIRNLVSIMTRIEMRELDSLGSGDVQRAPTRLATEFDLLQFLQAVKETFSELTNARFHLLFDDAGEPHIPREAQQVINDLILSSNPVYCVKVSAEKYTYAFESTNKKILENGHDYFEYDISAILYIGSKSLGLDPHELETYFRKILDQRLEYFEYCGQSIVDYLGDDQIKNEQLVNSLAAGRRNAYYCGWTSVWTIADRTPRNLLELVSEIFSAGNVSQSTQPAIIPNRIQNRAIRIISDKRLLSLGQISGVVKIDGKPVSLGRKLFEITVVVGSIFRIYLRQERGKARKDQYLGIERNDSSELNPDAEALLTKLVTFGVLDSVKMEFARDDRVKKPVYILNRIFCPAFGIGLRRDQHLRLSKQKLEQLFLDPIEFIKTGTRKLRNESEPMPMLPDLFGDLAND